MVSLIWLEKYNRQQNGNKNIGFKLMQKLSMKNIYEIGG